MIAIAAAHTGSVWPRPRHALAMLARRQQQPKIVKLSESIERALRQSTGLLDGLLDVSRLDAGAVQADWRDIDLVLLLDSIGHEFRHRDRGQPTASSLSRAHAD